MKNEDQKVKCENCKFFQISGNIFGECRRNAPVLKTSAKFAYAFPHVSLDLWCGEHVCKHCGGGAIYNGRGIKVACSSCGTVGPG